VAFPELSLTGYELDADLVAAQDDALTPIVEACASSNTLALVGAPIPGDQRGAHIATLGVTSTGVEVLYRKMFLGDEERHRFSPGQNPAVVEVDGWRLGLGICKDTGVAEHARRTAALGIDVYVAGVVHHAEELAEQQRRAVCIAERWKIYVAVASFAGSTGQGYDHTAASSAIWSPTGEVMARAGAGPGEVVRATLR
jgi:predicted amidohydrolase